MPSPAVQVAEVAAALDHVHNVLDGRVGLPHGGGVVEHQQHSGEDEDQEEECERHPQAEGGGEFQAAEIDTGRMDVQEKVA